MGAAAAAADAHPGPSAASPLGASGAGGGSDSGPQAGPELALARCCMLRREHVPDELHRRAAQLGVRLAAGW